MSFSQNIFHHRFPSDELFTEYQTSILRKDSLQSVIGIIVLLIPTVFFMHSDYILFQYSKTFFNLAAGRGLFILVSIVCITILLRTKTPSFAEFTVFVYLLSLIALIEYINLSRPPRYIYFAFIDLVVLLSIYFLFNTRLYLQMTVAFVFSILDLVVLWKSSIDMSPLAFNVILISYFVSNILGTFASYRLQSYRREQFLALKESQNNQTHLQEALGRVKTLSGLLPICSSCNKIRDDKGYWNRLEVYLEKHSDAAFSHSLCNDCVEKLYGEEDWYHPNLNKTNGS